jgi:hypothetical protein
MRLTHDQTGELMRGKGAYRRIAEALGVQYTGRGWKPPKGWRYALEHGLPGWQLFPRLIPAKPSSAN